MLLAAMEAPMAGVMIARGDLAVECGFERLAEVQEEVLWICEAAHVPVIWATQVLETLAKTGEAGDQGLGHRGECISRGWHLPATCKESAEASRFSAHLIPVAVLRRLVGEEHSGDHAKPGHSLRSRNPLLLIQAPSNRMLHLLPLVPSTCRHY
jgi:pyruvate kinase